MSRNEVKRAVRDWFNDPQFRHDLQVLGLRAVRDRHYNLTDDEWRVLRKLRLGAPPQDLAADANTIWTLNDSEDEWRARVRRALRRLQGLETTAPMGAPSGPEEIMPPANTPLDLVESSHDVQTAIWI